MSTPDHQLLHTKIVHLQKKYASNHYTKFLKNKSVIIVGPDTQLQGQKIGAEIDRFDVVTRHNTVFEYLPFSPQLKADYGSKTSVLYLAPQCIKDYAGKRSTLDKLKTLRAKHGLRFIVYQNGNRDGKYLTGNYCFEKQLNWFKKYCRQLKIEMHYSHHVSADLTRVMTAWNQNQSAIPRTGFISVFDLIIHPPKSLKIVGMSFYHGGGHAFRKKTIQKLNPKLNAYGKSSGSHNSVIELEIFDHLRSQEPYSNWITFQPPS